MRSILDEKSGLRSHEQGNKTDSLLTKRVASLPDLSLKDKALCTFGADWRSTRIGGTRLHTSLINLQNYHLNLNANNSKLAPAYAKAA